MSRSRDVYPRIHRLVVELLLIFLLASGAVKVARIAWEEIFPPKHAPHGAPRDSSSGGTGEAEEQLPSGP